MAPRSTVRRAAQVRSAPEGLGLAHTSGPGRVRATHQVPLCIVSPTRSKTQIAKASGPRWHSGTE
eukprot:6390416-Prymnesium_polylepis.1